MELIENIIVIEEALQSCVYFILFKMLITYNICSVFVIRDTDIFHYS